MTTILPELIIMKDFNAALLINQYPPRIQSKRKQFVYEIASPSGAIHDGTIRFSRWATVSLPEYCIPREWITSIDVREDVFGYEPPENSRCMEWYLNFAHEDLFCAYGSPLLAQDELQVAEHPALCSLRESLLASNVTFSTVESGNPTPVLIEGVERRCSIATDPNPAEDRPFGLYGNQFSKASAEALRNAVKPLKPPTITNIIAIEAPAEGSGRYSKEEIKYVLSTALAGFSAARRVSCEKEYCNELTIHTGFWGCGAYGGNKVLMVLLQILAANISKVNKLIFHTVQKNGSDALWQAENIIHSRLFQTQEKLMLESLINRIHSIGFEWGISDGN